MGFVINFVGFILTLVLKFYFWAIAIAIFAIVYLCRWLYKLSTTQKSDADSENNAEEFEDDGSEYCALGRPCEEQFCVNCDLVAQCQGWSPKRDKSDEHDSISDFLMFGHLLDSDDKHDENEHHVHDSFNCDDAWCECHENDGYSWFDEKGNENEDREDNDSCW